MKWNEKQIQPQNSERKLVQFVNVHGQVDYTVGHYNHIYSKWLLDGQYGYDATVLYWTDLNF